MAGYIVNSSLTACLARAQVNWFRHSVFSCIEEDDLILSAWEEMSLWSLPMASEMVRLSAIVGGQIRKAGVERKRIEISCQLRARDWLDDLVMRHDAMRGDEHGR